MSIICPTVTAFDTAQYANQLATATKIAERVHIDLMDGLFAPSVSPDVADIWLPHHASADIHLMYQRPDAALPYLLELQPHLVIIPFEAQVEHMQFASELHKHGIKAGLAILQDTKVDDIERVMHSFDHILVFSGHLGYHGGKADMSLLRKVAQIKELHPDAEIGWDGGIDNHNIAELIAAGVDVLNVGGFIQKSVSPQAAYATLLTLAGTDKSS